jgi:hypothetical protein
VALVAAASSALPRPAGEPRQVGRGPGPSSLNETGPKRRCWQPNPATGVECHAPESSSASSRIVRAVGRLA